MKNWKSEIIESKKNEFLQSYKTLMNNLDHKAKADAAIENIVHLLGWFGDNKILKDLPLNTKYSVKTAPAILAPVIRQLQSLDSNFESDILTKDFKETSNRIKKQNKNLVVICDNLKSGNNLGNIIRTAECLGFSKIITTGYTPSPSHKSSLKSSMGAELFLEWEHFHLTIDALESLKKEGYKIIGLETVKNGKTLNELKDKLGQTNDIAILLGNERNGIQAETLASCDYVFSLETFGMKNSLNVTNAFSAAGYLLLT